MTPAQKIVLWEAINRYVETCGGDPSGRVYGAISRQEAVVNVERAIDDIERWWRNAMRNVTESEGAVLERCSCCGCPPSSHARGVGTHRERECLECECKQYEAPR